MSSTDVPTAASLSPLRHTLSGTVALGRTLDLMLALRGFDETSVFFYTSSREPISIDNSLSDVELSKGYHLSVTVSSDRNTVDYILQACLLAKICAHMLFSSLGMIISVNVSDGVAAVPYGMGERLSSIIIVDQCATCSTAYVENW